MKIVQISYYIPWPLTHGGSEAQYFFLKEMSQLHDITLIVPLADAGAKNSCAELQRQLPKVNICGIVLTPAGRSGRIEARFHRLLLRLAETSRFVKRRMPIFGGHVDAAALTVSAATKLLHPDFVKGVGQHLSEHTDLVIIEFLETISAILTIPQRIPTIFINHQVQCVFDSRIQSIGFRNTNATYFAGWNRVLEGGLMSRFDGVIVFSDDDKKAILQEYGLTNVFVSRFPCPQQIGLEKVKCPADGRSLVFLGAESHVANRDGLEWFLEKVWPQIEADHPLARVRVVGNWSEGFRARYSKLHSVIFMGYVSELQSALRGAVMIVPIRIGSGVRVKILSAMACGIAVVSTSIGCEGIPFVKGVSASIADTPNDFADSAVELLRHPDRATRLAEEALRSVAPEFDATETLRKRLDLFEEIVASKRNSLNLGTASQMSAPAQSGN